MTFNLDNAIREWRRQLDSHPGIEPGAAEELELHLRDAIDSRIESGLTVKGAFEAAKADTFNDLDELASQYHYSSTNARSAPSWKKPSNILALVASYGRTAYRKLSRKRGYALVNIVGLAIALTCAFLALLFVVDELGFDRFHNDVEDLYRLNTTLTNASGETTVSRSPGPLAPLLSEVEPRIESTVRFIDLGKQFIRSGEDGLYFDGTMYVDSTFFEIFGFELLDADPEVVLRRPDEAVITQSAALRLFGEADATGKTFTIGMGGRDRDFRVQAVAANPPRHSHIQFDILLPFSFWESLPSDQRVGFDNWVMNWKNNRVITYARIRHGAEAAEVAEAIPAILDEYAAPDESERIRIRLEPVPEIYLKSELNNELGGPAGDLRYVYLLVSIGILILLIAGINFVNLSTAHAGERARETGVRKALGAGKWELTSQYLGESLVVASLAGIVAVVASVLLLSPYGDLVGKPFDLTLNGNPGLWLLVPALAAVVGLFSGIYPAILHSSFAPATALKTTGGTQTGERSSLRRVLVVSQFAAAGILFASTLIVHQQLQLFQQKKLGYSKEQIVVLPIDGSDLGYNIGTLKSRLQAADGVAGVSIVSYLPGQSTGEQSAAYPFRIEGMSSGDDPLLWDIMPVDHDFLDVMEVSLEHGRFFSLDSPADSTNAFVVNEATVRAAGWEDPVGQSVEWYMPGPDGFSLQQAGEVVGVVNDFHVYSLHQEIEPLVMVLPTLGWFRSNLAVRITSDNIMGSLASLDAEWQRVLPGTPFEYRFLDEDYASLYAAETTTGTVFSIMTALSLIVACLGLVGLTSFVTHQRTKEIGIRKVLGAGTLDIMMRLSRGFLQLVVVGVLISVPIAWMGMSRWLSRFAYSVEVDPAIFAIVLTGSLLIATLVVGYHTVSAARANPVESLRTE